MPQARAAAPGWAASHGPAMVAKMSGKLRPLAAMIPSAVARRSSTLPSGAIRAARSEVVPQSRAMSGVFMIVSLSR